MVKTMKSLAAVNIRQYERAVDSLEEYRDIVDMAWQILFRFSRPGVWKVKGTSALCMVIGSDQGMCGQFNEQLISEATEKVGELASKGLNVIFWSVGEKVSGAIADMGYSGGEQFSAPGNLTAILRLVQVVIPTIESWRSSRGIERFYLCHNVLDGGRYTQTFYRILPLDRDWAQQVGTREWPGRCLPLLGLPYEEMFTHLFEQYLFISFYRAFAQSLASENAARLMAMQAAEKNIFELEEELKAQFSEQRQASITNELLDIISGFEALSGEELF